EEVSGVLGAGLLDVEQDLTASLALLTGDPVALPLAGHVHGWWRLLHAAAAGTARQPYQHHGDHQPSCSTHRDLLSLAELFDFLLGETLDAGQETLHLPLRGVIGQDQLLRLRALGDVGDPVVEARRPPPHDGQPTEAHPLPALDLRQWLPAGLHT